MITLIYNEIINRVNYVKDTTEGEFDTDAEYNKLCSRWVDRLKEANMEFEANDAIMEFERMNPNFLRLINVLDYDNLEIWDKLKFICDYLKPDIFI
jgi:hypothetical protein